MHVVFARFCLHKHTALHVLFLVFLFYSLIKIVTTGVYCLNFTTHWKHLYFHHPAPKRVLGAKVHNTRENKPIEEIVLSREVLIPESRQIVLSSV